MRGTKKKSNFISFWVFGGYFFEFLVLSMSAYMTWKIWSNQLPQKPQLSVVFTIQSLWQLSNDKIYKKCYISNMQLY